ncbi:MAG: hypothetical protein EXQ51_12120 [Acidobacteria bacterium]|nr:hypothetical protein [Acidobacteriota bacterium]
MKSALVYETELIIVRTVVLLLTVLAAPALTASAQTSGTLSGRIVDASGAVGPGAGRNYTDLAFLQPGDGRTAARGRPGPDVSESALRARVGHFNSPGAMGRRHTVRARVERQRAA